MAWLEASQARECSLPDRANSNCSRSKSLYSAARSLCSSGSLSVGNVRQVRLAKSSRPVLGVVRIAAQVEMAGLDAGPAVAEMQNFVLSGEPPAATLLVHQPMKRLSAVLRVPSVSCRA